jgi:hypothetical protein
MQDSLVVTFNDNAVPARPSHLIDEFPGFELEQKFSVTPTPSTLKPFFSLRDALLAVGDFVDVRSTEHLKWVFYFDYYAISKNGALQQVFNVIHHPSTPRFWIREKNLSGAFEGSSLHPISSVLKRAETRVQIDEFWSDREISKFKRQKEEALGQPVFMLPRLTRHKHYTYVKVVRSSRTYSISIDLCHARGAALSQVETEYKWLEGQHITAAHDMGSLLADFDALARKMLDSPLDGFRIAPTTLSKFDWLASLDLGERPREYACDKI